MLIPWWYFGDERGALPHGVVVQHWLIALAVRLVVSVRLLGQPGMQVIDVRSVEFGEVGGG
ncbi:hypothetical protein CT688_05250 [Dietzia sp. JS16-p6b]|nr:hypothetical protein CT688_05250 [Dietzia sp. JS16-p6b]